MRKVITSYSNPDTDGVACMIGLNALYPQFKPVVTGTVSAETSFVLERVGIEEPVNVKKLNADTEEIIVVDTHHRAQLGEEFPYAKVTLVIDHHPSGDDELFTNANIDNRKIGAAASIVGEMVLASDIADVEIAKLLQYAIVSNTLNFTAPSTSGFDKEIFDRLSNISSISDEEIDEMFKHRSYKSVLSDVKKFDMGNGQIAIAQLEQYGMQLDIEKVKAELNRYRKENLLLFTVLNYVDIKNKRSLVVFSEGITDSEASDTFGLQVNDGVYRVDKILLRKTDFVPALMTALHQ